MKTLLEWNMKKNTRDSGTTAAAESSPKITVEATTGGWSNKSFNLFWLTGVVFVGLFFLVLKSYNIQPYSSDESIYINQGKLITEGFTPYEDYAMAHPPLQSIFIALIIKTVGYNFEFFRLIPALWCLLAGVLLSIMVRREYGSFAAVMAMGLYVLSYEPLRAASHFTGVNMTIAILMAAFLAQRKEKILLCAIFCVLAVFTRLYAIPAVMALVLSSFLRDRKEALHLVGYGATAGIIAFLMVGIWTGFGAFMNDVFLFQAQKTSMTLDKLQDMRDGVLFHNAIPFVLFLLGAFTVTGGYFRKLISPSDAQKKNKKKSDVKDEDDLSLVYLSVFAVIFICSILLNMDRVWMYYYVLAFPFGAITGGWLLEWWRKQLAEVFVALKSGTFSAMVKSPWLAGSLLIFIGAWFASPRLEKRLDYYKEKMREAPEKRIASYTWRDGKVPGFVNDLMKSLFWKDQRVIGEHYNFINYYLWHSSRTLDITEAVVDEIKKRTSEKDFIFGDSGTVPLFALLANRDIAGKEVDTNIERYRSGNADVREMVSRIDTAATKLILLRDNFGVAVFPEVKELVGRNYKEVKVFNSNTGFTLRMYERLPG